MEERIQKIMASRGVASRRASEELILQGRVTCNGQVCGLGDRADPEKDTILVDGRPLPSTPDAIYILLHKPRGYVTTLSDEKGRKNVSQLVSDCPQRVYPVGRLDMDSEGLLLLTNDGELANHLMHPSYVVDKVYQVWVQGFSPEGLERLSQPIELDGYRIRKPAVKCQKRTGDKALLQITIHEGRNRQIRRMCAIAGMEVQRLKRIREGSLSLGQLPLGKWRYLTKEEVKALRG
ncbi:MAG TPA: rRNA pseudouridine synthase [Candidatus Faecousia excrementipullorum]|nr:rRNA pseudouridine synthase [Candidatus Faecousia excrementipullorum]